MKFHHSCLICFVIYNLFSCTEKNFEIKHIPYLTEIDTFHINDDIINNRRDYFIIYNFHYSKKDKDKMNTVIQSYSDSFRSIYDNYSIFLFKESKSVDTFYIKSFGENYYYKALLDIRPDFSFQWWEGRQISKYPKP